MPGQSKDQPRIQLKGNVSAAAQPQFDRGDAPASTRLTRMRLVLRRSAAQQAALDLFERQLQDKSSPNFHRWLTPDEFGRLYGPAQSDINLLTAWLQAQGFSVDPVAPGHTSIAFSGTVSQVEDTFKTPIHAFDRDGRSFYANITAPEIPAVLAPLIQGIARLSTLEPTSSAIPATPGRMNPVTKRLEPDTKPAADGARPAYTANGNNLYVVPGDAATEYDTPNAKLNPAYTTGPVYDGTGVTIGIAGTAAINAATVVNYRTNFLGNTTAPTVTNMDDVTFTAGNTEPYLDIEIAGGLAPGATIHYYLANDLNTPIEQALTDNTVDILTFSYSECEKLNTSADNAAIESLWEQAATQGIAVTVSSGDSGSAGCDDPTTTNGADATDAVDGLSVNGYASTPYDIAVGGTDFDQLDNNFASYSSSGGSAATYYRTVLKYIPEATFNDSTQNNSALTYNMPWGVGLSIYPANITAGGGGASNCATNTSSTKVASCTAGYAKPSWQRGAGVPADAERDVPDISLMAGNGFYNASWLVCDDSASSSGTGTNNCAVQPDGSFNFAAYGGTSPAAPAFAGILALVQESIGGRLGQAAAQLYNLYNGSNASLIFHDVTQGNNAVPCTSGTPDCAKNGSGYYFESGYSATTGYDLASGLGSVDATQLINLWSSSSSDAPATVTVTPAATTIAATQSLSVAVTLTGSGILPTPVGTVTLTGGGYTSAAEPLTSGAVTFTIPANSLAAGSDTLAVNYSGDTNYAPATGSAIVTVTGVAPPPPPPPPATFMLSATSPAAVTPGSSATTTLTATSSSGYAGAITVSCALTSSPAGASNVPTCSVAGSPIPLSATTTSGAATATVATTAATLSSLLPHDSKWFKAMGGSVVLALLLFFVPGDWRKGRNLLGALLLTTAIGFGLIACGSSTPASDVSPTKATPAVTVTPASSSIVSNVPVSVAISVKGSPTTTPTGTVTLSSGNYTSAATPLASGAASITIPANSLSAGTDKLTATYLGDANDNGATGTGSLAVTSPVSVGGTTAGAYTFTITGVGNDAASTTATTTFTLTVN